MVRDMIMETYAQKPCEDFVKEIDYTTKEMEEKTETGKVTAIEHGESAMREMELLTRDDVVEHL
eukprot:7519178-Heterocapsa_arctica.AAC.1